MGCLTLVAGTFSGGMIGVLVSKIVQLVTRGPTCSELPTCDWHVYAGWGMLLGAITLPILTFRRLRQHVAEREASDRG